MSLATQSLQLFGAEDFHDDREFGRVVGTTWWIARLEHAIHIRRARRIRNDCCARERKYLKTYSIGSGHGSVQSKEEKVKPHNRASLAQSFSVKVFPCAVFVFLVCACVAVVVVGVIFVTLACCQWGEVMAALRRGARNTDRGACLRRVATLTAAKNGLAKLCAETHWWTRARCRRCRGRGDIPAGLYGKHLQGLGCVHVVSLFVI